MEIRKIPMCSKARFLFENQLEQFRNKHSHEITEMEDVADIFSIMEANGLKFSFELLQPITFSKNLRGIMTLPHAIEGKIVLDFDREEIAWIDDAYAIVKQNRLYSL